jgi:WD repeat-containing protein 35
VAPKHDDASERDDEHLDLKASQDHLRLLYLVSLYSKPAENDEESDSWIRSHALLVLIYEGVVTGALNLDYSSQSIAVGNIRVWMNVSQEGKDVLDDLREMKLINTVKLSTVEHGIVMAYQVSFPGLRLLKRKLTQSSQDAVNGFCFTAERQPLHVGIRGRTFFFYTADRQYSVDSKVTQTEDVSYVSSPYLPECLRRGSHGMTSNAHRAFESAAGKSDIRDEYNEVVSLGDVRVMVAEWVPFGDNAVVALMDKLGCQERVQGGFFSDIIDSFPMEEMLQTPAGLTDVRILEFDLLNYVNFEADINFVENEGIVQIENFGTHVRSDGFVLYGLKIEAIMDHGADNVSLDLMSRLLMDIQNDSSRIIDSLVSEYQRSVLDEIFSGNRATRDKFNMILAQTINPKMSASLFLDGKEHESEVKQILGDTFSSHDLSDNDVIIIGRQGLLVAGRGCEEYETILVSYMTVMCRERFIRYMYARIYLMDESLRRIRHLVANYDQDPNSINTVQMLIGVVSRTVILLEECVLYLEESVLHCSFPSPGNGAHMRKLSEVLNAGVLFESVKRRSADLRKNVKGASVELVSVQKMLSLTSKIQQAKMYEVLQVNTANLADLQRKAEISMAHVEVAKSLLGGIFAMELLDRLIGGQYQQANETEEQQDLANLFGSFRRILSIPGVLFVLVILFWFVLSKMWYERYFNRLAAKSDATITLSLRYVLNAPVNINRLKDMVGLKCVESEALEQKEGLALRKVVYKDADILKWRGPPPKIELHFDEAIQFLLRVSFYMDRSRTRITADETFSIFVQDLCLACVISVDQQNDIIKNHTPGFKNGTRMDL